MIVASKGGLGTGKSLQVLCVLGTGEGLTGYDGGPCPVPVYRGPETQVLKAKYRGPETQVLIAKYRGLETQVLRAKCNNTRVYCISLCKNTAAATEEESCFFPMPYITREPGGDQRVKESEWKMRRRGGRRSKEPEWAMGRTGWGGEFDRCIMHRVPTSTFGNNKFRKK